MIRRFDLNLNLNAQFDSRFDLNANGRFAGPYNILHWHSAQHIIDVIRKTEIFILVYTDVVNVGHYIVLWPDGCLQLGHHVRPVAGQAE